MTLNATATPTSAADSMSVADKLHTTIGAAFFGFVVGAILYGITLRQTYQYYTTTVQEKWIRKTIIALVVLLDTLHLVFSMYMVYSLILQQIGLPKYAVDVLWSLKALGSTQTIFIVFVQGFYLSKIWSFATVNGNILLSGGFKLAIQIFVGVVGVFALGIAVVFMVQLQRLQSVLSLSEGFEYMVYLGFGATALIDCAIATAMCLVLYKSGGGTQRGESVLESLIKYFIATGLLTSFAAIMCIVLYVAEPRTLLYLGMEFSVTRLYANSVLAMFNGRQSLRNKMDQQFDIQIPSGLLFGEPDTTSQRGSLIKGFRKLNLGSADYGRGRGRGGRADGYGKLGSPEEERYGRYGRYERSPGGTRSLELSPGGTRSYELSPGGTRSFELSPGGTRSYGGSPGSMRFFNLAHSPSDEKYAREGEGEGGEDDIGIEVEAYEEQYGAKRGRGRKGDGVDDMGVRGYVIPELRSSRNRGSVSPSHSMPASPSSAKSHHV